MSNFPLDGVRVETGVESGSTVTPYYDSMLAKLIAHAETRDEALDKLGRALDETSIFGITTNQAFLERLIDLPATRNATFHTRLIDEQIDQLADKTKGPDIEALALGAYFWMMRQRPPAPAFAESLAVARNDRHGKWRPATTDCRRSRSCISRRRARARRSGLRRGRLMARMIVRVNDDKLLVSLVPLPKRQLHRHRRSSPRDRTDPPA